MNLENIFEFVKTPFGIVAAVLVTAILSKNVPSIGLFLSGLFDRFFRPQVAFASDDVKDDISKARDSLHYVLNFWQGNGMPQEDASSIVSIASKYWVNDAKK